MFYPITSTIRRLLVVLSLFLVWNGLGVYGGSDADALYAYANLTGFAFWVVFLMGSVACSSVGRVACMACPVGELNWLASKAGLKRPVPLGYSWLQGLSLVGVFSLVVIAHVSRHPHYTAVIILAAFATALVLGLLFKGNAFCLLLCPANAYLRFYTRRSPLVLRGGAACTHGSERCMVFLDPCAAPREYCHQCYRCLPGSRDIRPALAPATGMERPFSNAEVAIFILLSGLVSMAFVRVVREAREIYIEPAYRIAHALTLPDTGLLGLVMASGIVVYPVVAYGAGALVMSRASGRSFGDAVRQTLPYLVPPLFATHLVLALVKLNTRIGFLPWALKDPTGGELVHLYRTGALSVPGDLVPFAVFRYVLVAIPAMLCIAGFRRVARDFRHEPGARAVLGVLYLLSVLLAGSCLYLWLFRGRA